MHAAGGFQCFHVLLISSYLSESQTRIKDAPCRKQKPQIKVSTTLIFTASMAKSLGCAQFLMACSTSWPCSLPTSRLFLLSRVLPALIPRRRARSSKAPCSLRALARSCNCFPFGIAYCYGHQLYVRHGFVRRCGDLWLQCGDWRHYGGRFDRGRAGSVREVLALAHFSHRGGRGSDVHRFFAAFGWCRIVWRRLGLA